MGSRPHNSNGYHQYNEQNHQFNPPNQGKNYDYTHINHKSELGKRTQVELESNSMTKLPRPETIDLREDNLFEER